MHQTDIRKLLEVAVVAARLAGQRAMEEIKYTKVSIKNNDEIVTQTDATCQKLIIDRIKESYPDHGFIGEEGTDGKLLHQPPRASDPVWWVIDPIDGSNNYAHGILSFAISIAAMYEGKPIVGVIFEPATDSMFTACQNGEAQLNSSRIQTRDEDINRFASFAINSDFMPNQAGPINEIMQRTRARNFGSSAIQLAYVAKGSLIGTITSKTKLWDFAAGAFIVEVAGGIVTDLAGNSPFPADLENYTGQNYVMLAANKKTHSQLLNLFAPLKE